MCWPERARRLVSRSVETRYLTRIMGDGTTKSARRVLEILELFRELRRPIALKEVCDRLGYAPSSGAGLLKTLVTAGYLEYDRSTRTYLPTMRIAVLAAWVPGMLFGRNDILPIMHRLQEASGLSVFLGTRSDLLAQYVHVIDPPGGNGHFVAPGTLRQLDQCCIGRLCLSTLSELELDRTIRRINVQRHETGMKVQMETLDVQLEEIRRQGYAFTRDLLVVGRGVLGMLLPEGPFNRTFVLGLGGDTAAMDDGLDANLAALRGAVAQIRSAAQRWIPPAADASEFGVPSESSLLAAQPSAKARREA